MADLDSDLRKAKAQLQAAERDEGAAKRKAAAAKRRVRRARLTLKKAKKDFKKATKLARKARVSTKITRKSFSKLSDRAQGEGLPEEKVKASRKGPTRKRPQSAAVARKSSHRKTTPRKHARPARQRALPKAAVPESLRSAEPGGLDIFEPGNAGLDRR